MGKKSSDRRREDHVTASNQERAQVHRSSVIGAVPRVAAVPINVAPLAGICQAVYRRIQIEIAPWYPVMPIDERDFFRCVFGVVRANRLHMLTGLL